MKDIRNEKLEKLSEEMVMQNQEEIAGRIVAEVAQLIVDNQEVVIDGVVLEDGSIDPAHILVDLDNRYYFSVYTSIRKFQKCSGAHAYVLSLAQLMQPIYEEDSFGGIALNMKKGEPMVLVSKEEIYQALQKRITAQS